VCKGWYRLPTLGLPKLFLDFPVSQFDEKHNTKKYSIKKEFFCAVFFVKLTGTKKKHFALLLIFLP